MFESRREQIEIVLKKYKEYVKLYKFFNKGSAEGATPFRDFYWRYTYYYRYRDSDQHNPFGG
jgi:hypothetical protein